MDSFLAVITRSKKRKLEGKLSLSCGDLAALNAQFSESGDLGTIKQRKFKGSNIDLTSTLPRFFKPKSSGSVPTVESLDRNKSKSSSELVNDFDNQLAEIRSKLAMFREQDLKFHERMDSLSHSIGELASVSRSSLNSFTPSEISASSDLMLSNEENYADSDDDDEQNHGDELIMENEISSSFSSEVLSCIPAIKVTSSTLGRLNKRRGSSDPVLHEAASLFKSSAPSVRPHSTYSTDSLHEKEIITLL